jgi:predicted O-methyltransferase YrrM
VLEIGVRGGVSTASLLLGIEEHGGHLYSVDIVNVGHLYEHPQWTFIHRDSKKVGDVMNIVGHEPLDVLLIDGDHSREAYISDLYSYSKFVKDGGLILSHDIDTRHGKTFEQTGNPRLVSEAVGETYFRFVNERSLHHIELPGGWAGMGVITWRA